MSELEKFLNKCESPHSVFVNGMSIGCAECKTLVSMLRETIQALSSYCCRCDIAASQNNHDVKYGWCRACETMEKLNEMAKDQKGTHGKE